MNGPQKLNRQRIGIGAERCRPAVVGVDIAEIFAEDFGHVLTLVIGEQLRVKPAGIVASVEIIDEIAADNGFIERACRLHRHLLQRFDECGRGIFLAQLVERAAVIHGDAVEERQQSGAEIVIRTRFYARTVCEQTLLFDTLEVGNGVCPGVAADAMGRWGIEGLTHFLVKTAAEWLVECRIARFFGGECEIVVRIDRIMLSAVAEAARRIEGTARIARQDGIREEFSQRLRITAEQGCVLVQEEAGREWLARFAKISYDFSHK